MSDNKPLDRRAAPPAHSQDNKDLNSAITELHQTIVRLNKAIERVHPKARAEAKKNFGHADTRLSLETLEIPEVLH